MKTELIIILAHQVLFQGMFFIKNIILKRRLKKPIRGWNKEAMISIGFFIIFIALSIVFASENDSIGSIEILDPLVSTSVTTLLLLINLMVSAMSLLHLRDSWRVGVLEDQNTALVTSGIYRFTRNPYFVSYLLMFIAYPMLLQNWLLLILSIIGFTLVHWMILKEESYLFGVHGEGYKKYTETTRRYL